MKVKVSEATPIQLDWMVEMVECDGAMYSGRAPRPFSTDWAQGGSIIEREGIGLNKRNEHYLNEGFWQASYWKRIEMYAGLTPLIAAMRCYVASRLGDEVEIPEELK